MSKFCQIHEKYLYHEKMQNKHCEKYFIINYFFLQITILLEYYLM